MNDNVIIVWCDSPLGLISTRVNEDGRPVFFSGSELDESIPCLSDDREVFAILRKRDGTKIAIRDYNVKSLFGWTF